MNRQDAKPPRLDETGLMFLWIVFLIVAMILILFADGCSSIPAPLPYAADMVPLPAANYFPPTVQQSTPPASGPMPASTSSPTPISMGANPSVLNAGRRNGPTSPFHAINYRLVRGGDAAGGDRHAADPETTGCVTWRHD